MTECKKRDFFYPKRHIKACSIRVGFFPSTLSEIFFMQAHNAVTQRTAEESSDVLSDFARPSVITN